MTAIAEALEKAGVSPALSELRTALSKFINRGGTCEQIRAEVDAIEKRMSTPGEGHLTPADSGHLKRADAWQSIEGERASLEVPQGHSAPASSSSPDRGGAGHKDNADGPAHIARPVRESTTKRGLASILSMQGTIRRGLLEMKKTSDGRAWAEVGWHELDGMDRDGALARLIRQGTNPPTDRFALLKHCLTDSQFEEFVNAAKAQNDVRP